MDHGSEAASEAAFDILGPEPGDETLGSGDGFKMALRMAKLYEREAELDADLAEIKAELKKLEQPVIDWMIQNENPSSTYSETVLYLTTRVFSKAKPEAIVDGSLAEALQEIGADPDEFIRPTVNSNTLSKFVREIAAERRAHANDPDTLTRKVSELLPAALAAAIEVSEVPRLGHRASPRRR